MKLSDIRIGFVPIARPTFDLELARDMIARIHEVIQNAGYQVVGSQDLIMDGPAIEERIDELKAANIDMILMAQASFADSTMLLQLAQAIRAPLLMWAFPEEQVGGRLRINSFCGINLAAHGLRRAGLGYETVYATPEDVDALKKLSDYAITAGIKSRLVGTRIGRLGENPEGFDTCLVNLDGLRTQLGVDVVQYELEPFFERVRQAEPVRVNAVADALAGTLAGIADVDAEATRGTLGSYLTLDASHKRTTCPAWRCAAGPSSSRIWVVPLAGRCRCSATR